MTLENILVDIDDAIVKQCVEPKARVPPRGFQGHYNIWSTIWFSRSTMGPTAPVLLHSIGIHYCQNIKQRRGCYVFRYRGLCYSTHTLRANGCLPMERATWVRHILFDQNVRKSFVWMDRCVE